MLWIAIAALAWAVPRPLEAQRSERLEIRNAVFTNSEIETYLRHLQAVGQVAAYPWSIRSFSPREVDRLLPTDSLHPWVRRYDLTPDTRRGLRVDPIAPQGTLHYNSAFPYGPNLGPVWAGRGVTGSLLAGFSARYGPASLVVAPLLFQASNRAFELAPTGYDGAMIYADPRLPLFIDLPQRFGDDSYARLDPGQSTLRLDLPGVTLGISTANQHWGPAGEYPILLGNNAAGYLHGFVGAASPLDLWIARLHGRLVWGRLEQSEFTSITGTESRRFMSGFIVLFSPRGIDGLELGMGRFYHIPWPEGGLRTEHFQRPLEAFLKKSRGPQPSGGFDEFSTVENQLASVFARWVLPGSGFEIYGEYGREDHNWDLRDFLLEPDHASAYVLGFRKVWPRSPTRFAVLRGEVLNSEISHLVQVREQRPFYQHSGTRQGHTHRGQILGASTGYGGAGSVLGVDLYHTGGRWSASWTRELRNERLGYSESAAEATRFHDMVHTLGVDGLFFVGRFDVTAGLRAVQNYNRNFAGDAFNLHAALGVRAGL